ncbi:MAG: DUF885 family protein, partial [Desulfobacterales bacterium]
MREKIQKIDQSPPPIGSIACQIFNQMALRFPVCMASDEFHFFPQARSTEHNWSFWDDFSSESLQTVSRQLSRWDQDLDRCKAAGLSADLRIDVRTLQRMIKTILEQFTRVGVHRTQPTFYLTILSIGIAEAIEAGTEALNSRMQRLPEFLEHAERNLQKIPRIFRDMGCEMISGLIPWLKTLQLEKSAVAPAIDALDQFQGHLTRVSTTDEFLLSRELYDRITFHHIGCHLQTDEIAFQLDREISETGLILNQSAGRINSGLPWQETIAKLPVPPLPQGGVKQLYHQIIADLTSHCVRTGLVTPELAASCPVKVEEIPDYMLPVRSNAAFSMPPGHPPQGGTLFIMASDNAESVTPDYRLLAAHETFPGHHLLDTCRWGLGRALRRHIEFPIFYEGWASFAEELLFDTGFFSNPIDEMLLAKRRFWRAIRGRVDLDIHTGKLSLAEAASFLVDKGMDRRSALAMVRRYILKPG